MFFNAFMAWEIGKMEFADLHAYQASAEGMIGRQVHDLVSIAGDLTNLAAVPQTRQLLAGERGAV
jgi:hypothetical protein